MLCRFASEKKKKPFSRVQDESSVKPRDSDKWEGRQQEDVSKKRWWLSGEATVIRKKHEQGI